MASDSIFKAYDIRGIYPDDLNEETAFEIGQRFISCTGARRIAVGRDMRLSSPQLLVALIKGITSLGADVYNVGLVPTEAVYFSVGFYNYDAGIMITASHNPKKYNGFKMMKKENDFPKIIGGEDLKKSMKEIKYKGKEPGRIEEIDIWPDYLDHIFSLVDIVKINPLRIVVDAGNGMAAKVISLITEKLPVEIIPLNFTLDGNFPHHSPNPLEPGATSQISQAVKKEKADAGFIFDGDADRIYLIDEKGKFVRADITFLLLAGYFLEKNPNKAVVYNLICSKSVPEFIKKWGGKPVRTPVGFIHIQKNMFKNQGIIGGELSGHYSFRDNYYSDSGIISFLILLQAISQSNKNISDIVKELSPYAKGLETNFKVENKEEIIKKIREKYSDGKQDYLDGITVEYNDWWFNVRLSNTEPLLRLTIEADNEKLLGQKQKEIGDLIKKPR